MALKDEILQMVHSTESPKDRAYLMILFQIHESLTENTETTRSLAEQFEAHVEAFDNARAEQLALINQGRGGWRVAAAFFSFMMLVLSGVVGILWSDYNAMRVDNKVAERALVELGAIVKYHIANDPTPPAPHSK